jgi:type III secretory pathway component EscS
MIRESLVKREFGKGAFRWRSHEISRIEGLSDAVFAFAITLLVVSLEVPKTFHELTETMRGFGAFAVCFVLLFTVWLTQYKYFRRYGLQDGPTTWLNAALIFVVLFYVYPLKFLFTFLVDKITGGHGEVRLPDGTVTSMLDSVDQMGKLMLIFSAGYLAVFLVFVLLYRHAYKKRAELDLNELEIFDTKSSIQESALNCGIAILSISIILIGGANYSGVAGMIYMLTGVAMGVHGTLSGSRRRRLEQRLLSKSPAVAEVLSSD